MATITCKIPERLDAELKTVAEKRRVSKSKVVREAIESVLKQEKRGRLSAHDVLKEGCGIVKRGPRDRSSNPKHLESFGRE